MITSFILRLTFAGAFLALLSLTTPTAEANCGGCSGGDKKDYPAPTPAPSPAK